jgi:N-acetylneuraminic acid mutarotase
MQSLRVGSMWSPVLLMAAVACNGRATEPSESEQLSPLLAAAGVGSWAPRASMPTPRQGLAAAVVQNASGQYILYTIGGCCGTSYTTSALARVEAYNASTNTWTRKADLPTKRADLNGAEVIGGKIYVPGGSDANGAATKTLYVYNPTTNTWSQKANLPRSISGGITAVIGGKLFLLTGGVSVLPQRLYRYDPSTNTWTRRADLPRDHRSGSGAVINGKLYVVWGHSPTVDEYDPATNKWTRRLTMSKTDWPQYSATQPDGSVTDPVLFLSGAINLSNRLHLIGGIYITGDNDAAYSAETHAYDPITNRWTKKASLARARADMGVGKIKNAVGQLQIIVTGGEADPFDGKDILRTTEAFTP